MTESQRENKLDIVLAYVLGDLTEDERRHFELLLANGDEELSKSYELALATFAELPSALTSAIPPPFVKDAVMARVHEDAVSYLVADASTTRRVVPIATRILNVIPGYGAMRAPKVQRSRSSVRRLSIAAVFLAMGLFASAYAFEVVRHAVERADAAREVEVARIRNYQQAKAQQTAYLKLNPTEHDVATADLGQGNMAGATYKAGSNLAIEAVSPVEPGIAEAHFAAKTPRVLPTPVSQRVAAERAPIDLKSFEGALYFMNDPSSLHFDLEPVNRVKAGNGTVYWNKSHAEAIFSISGLAATEQGQTYVLSYILDDGSHQTISRFTSVSGAGRQVILEHAPSAHVIGAQLYLQSQTKNGAVSNEVVLAAASVLRNK